MSSHKKKKVSISSDPSNRTEIIALRSKMADGNALFSFRFFCPNSVRVGDFNNYYVNRESAVKSAIEFIDLIREVSRIKWTMVYSTGYRKSLRVKETRDDDAAIDRIERVLVEGYGFPKDTVDQFERSYIELAFGDGHRLITVCVDGIFEILFVDNNHLICRESSRFVSQKDRYEFPCLFDEAHLDVGKVINEYNIAELVMEDVVAGKYEDVNKIIKDYEDLRNT